MDQDLVVARVVDEVVGPVRHPARVATVRPCAPGEPDGPPAGDSGVGGYPRSIDADMIVNAIDDEVSHRLTDYRPLR